MILHIIPVRSASNRLPEKIFKKIGKYSLLEHHLRAVTQGIANKVIIAIPTIETKTEQIKEIAEKYKVEVLMPEVEPNNVLDRYVEIAKYYDPDWIVRTTQDCWQMDTDWYNRNIRAATTYRVPIFQSNQEWTTLEVFKYSDLLLTKEHADKDNCAACKEHVTWHMRLGLKRKGSIDTLEQLEEARAKYGR